MAQSEIYLYSNYPTGTNTSNALFETQTLPDPTIQWSWSCDGYIFSHWNTQSDGSGTSYNVGTSAPAWNLYAIWEEEDVDLITKKSNLKSIADAIRTKGGTSASLEYPNDFITAIEQIEAGGSGYTIDDIAERNMMSGEITGNASFIANYAFTSCSSLTTVNFPNCTSIGYNAFQQCSSLTTISFPNCTLIGYNAFNACCLTTASFPNCTIIRGNAFYGCTSLTTISFPKCISIGESAFNACTHLTTVDFPKCTSIGSSAFNNCSYLTTVSFSKAITTIYTGTFQNAGRSATSITMISFYSYVNAIQSYAFRSCYKLKQLYLNHVSQVPTLSASAFHSSPMSNYSTSLGAWGSIYVPTSLLASFKAATNWTAISARIVAVNIDK